MNLTINPPNGRGCGDERTEGAPYACCGVSANGMPIEHFIIDPARLWPTTVFRGARIMPRYKHRADSPYDLIIAVSKEDYPSPADFWMEAAKFGASRKLSSNLPFELLTPPESRMVFLHRRAIPAFDYVLTPPEADAHGPLYGCKWRFDESEFVGLDIAKDEVWGTTPRGWHPSRQDLEVDPEPCTLALRDLAVLLHPEAKRATRASKFELDGVFTIEMPSFSYNGRYPLYPANGDDLKWLPGLFMALPLTHFEFPKKGNADVQERLNRRGYDAPVTDW